MATGAGRFDSHSTTRPTCGVRHGKGSLHTNAACVALGTRKRVKRRLAFFLGAKRFCCRAFSIRRGQCCCIYGECRAAHSSRTCVDHWNAFYMVLASPATSHQPGASAARHSSSQSPPSPRAVSTTDAIAMRHEPIPCERSNTSKLGHSGSSSFSGIRQANVNNVCRNTTLTTTTTTDHQRTIERTNERTICLSVLLHRAFVRSCVRSIVRSFVWS